MSPDEIFAHPRLAAVYDDLDPDRSDLEVYVELVLGLGARRVLDVGCGTGTFALMLASAGIEVTGVDPARASVDVARGKPGAERVTWLDGDASTLPPLQVDVATMTANVAQVFLTDESWEATLRGIRAALRPGAHLVFETRVPARHAWEDWTPEATRHTVEVAGHGRVTEWIEVLDVDLPWVRFRSPTVFEDTAERIDSESTLRFRSREELDASLDAAAYDVVDVREAPDRPGRELVYVARKRSPGPRSHAG